MRKVGRFSFRAAFFQFDSDVRLCEASVIDFHEI